MMHMHLGICRPSVSILPVILKGHGARLSALLCMVFTFALLFISVFLLFLKIKSALFLSHNLPVAQTMILAVCIITYI